MACDYAHRRDVRRRRRLRCIRPNVWNLCTSRTRRAEYSFSELTPDDRAVLWGFVIMAAKRYGVALAHIVVMSNHLHCLVRAARPKAISLFHGYFKARFAKYINEKHGRTGNIWAGRFHNVNLLDDEAQIGALSYGIDHGMKSAVAERVLEAVVLLQTMWRGRLNGFGKPACGRSPPPWPSVDIEPSMSRKSQSLMCTSG